MPMRPQMSVMEETDVPPGDRARRRPRGDRRRAAPTSSRASRPTLTVEVRDAETGDLVDDLVRTHQVWMHLIVTRADLGTFAHLHPEPTGRAGVFTRGGDVPDRGELRAAHRVPPAGPDGRRAGRPRRDGRRPGAGRRARPGRRRPRGHRRRRHAIALDGDARVGRPATSAHGATGVDDLQPYLGAAGHVVVMRGDGSSCSHTGTPRRTTTRAGPCTRCRGRVRARARPARAVRRARRLPALGAVPAGRRDRRHRAVRRARGLRGLERREWPLTR